uniref:Col_cuticle_N domain-containing protein n=1 Tax=Steinernema glaseri TaxID=37863 RepID=A0A1I8A7U0_9BILA
MMLTRAKVCLQSKSPSHNFKRSSRVRAMPKQDFDLIDMMGPLVAAAIFIVCLFLLSVCINFTCIKEDDDRTVYEKVALAVLPHLMSLSVWFALEHQTRSAHPAKTSPREGEAASRPPEKCAPRCHRLVNTPFIIIVMAINDL